MCEGWGAGEAAGRPDLSVWSLFRVFFFLPLFLGLALNLRLLALLQTLFLPEKDSTESWGAVGGGRPSLPPGGS